MSGFDSLRGQFLIAGQRLRDENFYRTVVLMVEHSSEGAMGLVINRPSGISVSSALSEHFQLPETSDVVYVGGPVEPSALFILHNTPSLDETEAEIVPGLYVGSSARVFETVVRTSVEEEDSELKFRIYSGCAGWSAGQLEQELANGDWLQCPASCDIVLHEDPYHCWDAALQQVRDRMTVLPRSPVNPELN